MSQYLLDREAKTCIVEAIQDANAGEIKAAGVKCSAGCSGCHGHGLCAAVQVEDRVGCP